MAMRRPGFDVRRGHFLSNIAIAKLAAGAADNIANVSGGIVVLADCKLCSWPVKATFTPVRSKSCIQWCKAVKLDGGRVRR